MNYAIGDFVFNDWQITREIGEGATGKVFEIEKNDSVITAKSALKVIRIPRSVSDVKTVMSEGMDEKSVTQYFREFVDEILREIKVMVSLKDHPNIVAYEDHTVIAHEDGVGWDILIKMELLTPLTEWMLNHPIDENTTIRIGSEISSALTYAFDNGLVHRDVKPENIFVDHTGHFKLGDFGIARTIEKTTGGLSKKGTESYMAPEVYLGKPYNEQIDIYSLGIVLYRLMNNNRLPFYPPIDQKISFSDREAALMKRVQGTPLPAPCNGSKEFQAIILKACEYLPENRYGTMHELYNDLQKLKKTTREIPPAPAQENPFASSEIAKTQSQKPSESKKEKSGTEDKVSSTAKKVSSTSSNWKKYVAVGAAILAVGGIGIFVGKNMQNGSGGSSEPVVAPAAEPTETPTPESTEAPTPEPTATPTPEPTATPEPTETPTPEPTETPTPEPTATPVPRMSSVKIEGSGSAENSFYYEGDTVTITAEPPVRGAEFAGWTVNSGDAVLADFQAETTSFVMPGSDVSLTANYDFRYVSEAITGGEVSGHNFLVNAKNDPADGALQLTELGVISVGDEYEYHGFLSGTYLIRVKDPNSGSDALMDLNGKLLTEFKYSFKAAQYGWCLAMDDATGKYGVFAMDGSVAVPFKYDNIDILNEYWIIGDEGDSNMTAYSLDGNNRREAVIPKKSSLSANAELLRIKDDVSVDLSFSIVPGHTSSYDRIKDSLYEKGISATYYQPGWCEELGYVITESYPHYGVCDLNGNWIIPEEYDRIALASCGYFEVEKDGKIGYIRKDGVVTCDPATSDISDSVSYDHPVFAVATANIIGDHGIVSANGVKTIFDDYPIPADGDTGLIWLGMINGSLYNLYDWNGNVLKENYAQKATSVSFDGKYALIGPGGYHAPTAYLING